MSEDPIVAAVAALRMARAEYLVKADRITEILHDLEDFLTTPTPAVPATPALPAAASNGAENRRAPKARKGSRRHFDPAYKADVVRIAILRGVGVAAAEHGLNYSIVRRWMAEGHQPIRAEGIAPPFDGEIAEDLNGSSP